MIYYSESDLVIRIMRDSDIQLIINAEAEQGVQVSPEELRRKLIDQEKLKNFVLIAIYKGEIAGYITIYLFSDNGPFKGEGYSEIADMKVFERYRDLGIETKLLNVSESVGAEYSDTVYLSVGVHNGEALSMYIKRGYTPDESGVWNKNEICCRCSDCENEEELVLWLYKKMVMVNVHKLPMVNTTEFPFLRWWADKIKTVYSSVNIEKYQKIEVGDDITLEDTKSNDFVKGRVVFKHEYDTYEKLLKFEGGKNIFPFLKDDDFEKALLFYKTFVGYELIKKFGCVALGIKVADSDDLDEYGERY